MRDAQVQPALCVGPDVIGDIGKIIRSRSHRRGVVLHPPIVAGEGEPPDTGRRTRDHRAGQCLGVEVGGQIGQTKHAGLIEIRADQKGRDTRGRRITAA